MSGLIMPGAEGLPVPKTLIVVNEYGKELEVPSDDAWELLPDAMRVVSPDQLIIDHNRISKEK